MVFDSQPLPLKRLASSGVLCGWMNSTAPSSSALAQTGWNLGSEKSSPQHAAADGGAAQALFLDRGLQLLHGEVGKLQGQRGESPEPIRPRRAQLRQLLVIDLDDRGRRVAVLAVPERIDRQHLHVDRHRVHLLETLLDDDEMLGNALDRRQHLVGLVAHQVDGFMKIAVRVNVDGQDALAADLDRQARRLRLRAGRIQHAATAKGDPGRGSALQKFLRVVIGPSLDGLKAFPWAGRLIAGSFLDFFARHIAKPEAGGQSFRLRIVAGHSDNVIRLAQGEIRHAPASYARSGTWSCSC